ncbi:hypothetical protein [Lacinutrix sp. MEBiC02404]
MKHLLLCFTFLFSISYAFGQTSERVSIQGKVIFETNEVENLVIYNKTANDRTLTDVNGGFIIDVALEDHLEISGLRFKTFLVTITPDIMASKELTAFLVERVNDLDEVVILPFGLSGNLTSDLTKLRTFDLDLDAIYTNVENEEQFKYTEPQYLEVENMILKKDQFYNGVDFVKITNWLIKPRLKTQRNLKKDPATFSNFDDLRMKHRQDFINANFGIPKDRVESFIVFAENNNSDITLLDAGKDVELIEYLVQQSKLFLASEEIKN